METVTAIGAVSTELEQETGISFSTNCVASAVKRHSPPISTFGTSWRLEEELITRKRRELIEFFNRTLLKNRARIINWSS